MLSFGSMIKKQKSFCGGICLIVLSAIFLSSLFYFTNQCTVASIDTINGCNVEDFSFLPQVSNEEILKENGDYSSVLSKKANILSEQYDFTWEDHSYKYVSEESTFIVFDDKRKIDQYIIEKGSLPKQGEIVVNKSFFLANDFKLGDTIWISNASYTVSGAAVFPDYIYPQVSKNGSSYNSNSEAIVVLNNADFNNLKADINYNFAAVINPPSDKNKVIAELRNDSEVASLLTKDENIKIFSMVNSKLAIHRIILIVVITIFSVIALFMVALLLTRMIKSETQQLGILKALGYKSSELARKYIFIGIIIFIACVIGLLLAYIAEPYYYKSFNEILQIPEQTIKIDWFYSLTICIVLPIIFAMFSYAVTILNIRFPALHLIKNLESVKLNKKAIRWNRIDENKSFLNQVRSIFLKNSKGTVIMVLIAGFSIGTLVQLAFTIGTVSQNLASDATKEYGYSFDTRFIELTSEKKYSGIYYQNVASRLCDKSGNDLGEIELYVLEHIDLDLLKINNEKNKKIDLGVSEGLVINTWFAQKYSLSKGDSIYVNIAGKMTQLSIAQVSNGIFGNTAYCNFKYAIHNNIVAEEVYNGILTNDEISNEVLFTTTTASIEESINSSNGVYLISAVICLLCGLAIGIPLLVLSFMNVINTSKKNLTILRINGYTTQETNQLILSTYRYAAYLGLLISIPYTYLVGKIMFGIISKASTMIFSLYISFFSIAVTVFLTVFIVEFILFIFRFSIKNLSHRTLIEG